MNMLFRYFAAAAIAVFLAACGGGSNSVSNSNTPPVVEAGTDTSSTVLPKMYINTTGGAEVANTEDYLTATVRIESENGTELAETSTQIRGRGNTTWGMPKKPYRLKLDKAASMLGMPAERDWALLANYADKSLMRNKLAMELGEKVGLSYNPRSKIIELYFNDAYQGVYQLFEHVKVGPNRVNVAKLDRNADIDSAIITGGYFLEVDHRLDEDVCWHTSLNVPICAKDPEYDPENVTDSAHPSFVQYNYITSYLNSAEQAINTPGNTYQNYFDVDSMVNWYLVSELMKNDDSQINAAGDPDRFTSSVYLYKPRGGKLAFGPLWDFDIAAGNINYSTSKNPTGWHVRDSVWYGPLFEHSDFGQRVFTKWCALWRDGTVSGLGAEIDKISARIDQSAIDRNFEKWDILGIYVWPNEFIGKTYSEEVAFLKKWMQDRASWMHAEQVREFGECPVSGN